MKQLLHKIFSICMALLLMASTISWTMGKHYCMGRLMDVSFFDHAEDCGMNMDGALETSFSDEMNFCCNDELIVVEGQDDLKITFQDLEIEQQSFLIALTHSYIHVFSALEEGIDSFRDYSPPPLIRDVHILDQTFLI